MSSEAPKPTNKGGGILRSRQQKINGSNGGSKEGHASGRVTFSSKGGDNDGVGGEMASSRNPTINTKRAANDGGYDSDEVEDDIMAMAVGDSFSMGKQQKAAEGDTDMDDAAMRTSTEIEEAKRKRGRVRRSEDHETKGDLEKDDMDDDDGKDDPGMSLITDEGADPDAYESNATGNAACPVEPFNMDSEKEGGGGYFDGDTYVFRHNGKPVDGEEDAWLDGFGDDEEGGGKGEGGGLDSTSIWKPRQATKDAKQKSKSKFVNEDAIPEDLGRRVVTLLQNDNETVMAALTRHGASLRELQAQEQKMIKKTKLKKRKSSKNQSKKEGDDSSQAPASGADVETKQLKIRMAETRETVEELTELADALLFGGENDAYDLTKSDWIHQFKLEQYFPSEQKKRPPEADVGDMQAKKKSRGYFEGTSSKVNEGKTEQTDTTEPQHCEVMWEYKGNEDGAMHGPYTSRQMSDWTSCGYFVGESAVDIRRVGSNGAPGKDATQKSNEDVKTDVDDLMADLMDDDDEGETNTETGANAESSWMRSDRVDFSLYL
mmetsp:Transcript_27863/g.50395  ORF Transcript_27863/g.50395 Transcript_27863/m.50395 type:complete len:546 (-) Transcript_27863:178-1815(-)|eukprot:CAMPEP_0201936080 /NCGR_PEP_ID=MMETSP0903-20130614/36788_1 /ASSEMBLY_ACC=CAM_ASM_000552 /TAXON_ID=420261 /ORGANISM="Thalassiosira antarctica, Strain CCMP982" /LENGTH=545 /DNA_ID=CAMNT_0048476681 /DNA_START=24 /DNA_END=1661 /DNA_ORIENTATION=-